MRSVNDILKTIRGLMPVLQQRFGVSKLEVFGSFVRGEQQETSDIDILVDFSETTDLFKFIELENYMSDNLGMKVDLVMRETLKPRIKDAILREAVPV